MIYMLDFGISGLIQRVSASADHTIEDQWLVNTASQHTAPPFENICPKTRKKRNT